MKTFFVISATILLAIPLVLLMTVSFPVVLSAILLVGIPLSIHDKKSHTTAMNPVVSDAHTLSIPELGLTMADGGEKVASPEARAAGAVQKKDHRAGDVIFGAAAVIFQCLVHDLLRLEDRCGNRSLLIQPAPNFTNCAATIH